MKAYAAVNRVNLSMNERIRIRHLKEFHRSPTVDEVCCHPLRASEHDRVLRQFRLKGAPGLDVIPPLYLKVLYLRAKASCWKPLTAASRPVIMPLQKAGIQPVAITSHRLVSLITCVAKAMEHMIHNRL